MARAVAGDVRDWKLPEVRIAAAVVSRGVAKRVGVRGQARDEDEGGVRGTAVASAAPMARAAPGGSPDGPAAPYR